MSQEVRFPAQLRSWSLALLSLCLLVAATACESPAELTLVRPEHVCMVTDAFFGKDQIPVTFVDRTYYGCCAGCEKRIREDPRIRAAIDPVSGARVDKATAVIGAREDGAVFYFESIDSMRKYRSNQHS